MNDAWPSEKYKDMKHFLIMICAFFLPMQAWAQDVGGEIRRQQQQQQTQSVRSQTQPAKPQQQAEVINYDTYNAALVKKAESGDAVAQYSLGLVYENGWGVDENISSAVEWYMLAANKGNANAQYHLGLCYENGNGVKKDTDLAVEWYQKASAQGIEMAHNRVDAINAERQRLKEQEEKRLAEEKAKQKAEQEKYESLPPVIQNLISNMVHVEGGTFTMGATSEQGSDAWDDERPTHQVTLSSFSIGKYEVTQEEWEAVMGNNPSNFKGAKKPVEQVSWNDCQAFIRKLNELTGRNFRLPSEAEWEFAARGGTKSIGYKYAGGDNIGNVAWYTDNSGSTTHDVGQKSPNELGLYDMSGNVFEWCQDWYGSYSSSSQTNPKGAISGSDRVNRGGSWGNYGWRCRVSNRNGDTPSDRNYYLGFRLAQKRENKRNK